MRPEESAAPPSPREVPSWPDDGGASMAVKTPTRRPRHHTRLSDAKSIRLRERSRGRADRAHFRQTRSCTGAGAGSAQRGALPFSEPLPRGGGALAVSDTGRARPDDPAGAPGLNPPSRIASLLLPGIGKGSGFVGAAQGEP